MHIISEINLPFWHYISLFSAYSANHGCIISPDDTRLYLPDISFTLTNRIYLGDVSSQNLRMNSSWVGYEQFGVRHGGSLESGHWILCRAPTILGRWENAAKKCEGSLIWSVIMMKELNMGKPNNRLSSEDDRSTLWYKICKSFVT